MIAMLVIIVLNSCLCDEGVTILGEGGFFNKEMKGWFDVNKPHLLSMQNPHDPGTDTSSNSYNVSALSSPKIQHVEQLHEL